MTIAPACQCSKHPGHPCDRPITQEDLRCDTCGGRDPKGYTCGSIRGLGNGQDQYHLPLRIHWGDYHAVRLRHDQVMEAVEAVVPELLGP